MASDDLALIVLEGRPLKTSPVEKIVRLVRRAAIYDNLEKFSNCPAIKRCILATNDNELVEYLNRFKCEVHFFQAENTGFHFGKLLTEIINKNNLRKVFYIGGGSGVFLTPEEIFLISSEILEKENIFIANNVFSSDFAAFSPADVVNSIDMPRIDNLLAYLLREEGGLDYIPLGMSMGTIFDIDTPSDLLVLGVCSNAGEKTRKTINSLNLNLDKVKKMLSVFEDGCKEILICGRVSPQILTHLERHISCRLRVFSEERGMKARGRIERGEVKSIIGSFLSDVGIDRFFDHISSICDGAFIDSRVLFAHLKKNLSKQDRFLSDLGEYECIDDDFVREFTKKSMESPVPIILGGHSLISGGLWVLGEMINNKKKESEKNADDLRILQR